MFLPFQTFIQMTAEVKILEGGEQSLIKNTRNERGKWKKWKESDEKMTCTSG